MKDDSIEAVAMLLAKIEALTAEIEPLRAAAEAMRERAAQIVDQYIRAASYQWYRELCLPSRIAAEIRAMPIEDALADKQ